MFWQLLVRFVFARSWSRDDFVPDTKEIIFYSHSKWEVYLSPSPQKVGSLHRAFLARPESMRVTSAARCSLLAFLCPISQIAFKLIRSIKCDKYVKLQVSPKRFLPCRRKKVQCRYTWAICRPTLILYFVVVWDSWWSWTPGLSWPHRSSHE